MESPELFPFKKSCSEFSQTLRFKRKIHFPRSLLESWPVSASP